MTTYFLINVWWMVLYIYPVKLRRKHDYLIEYVRSVLE